MTMLLLAAGAGAEGMLYSAWRQLGVIVWLQLEAASSLLEKESCCIVRDECTICTAAASVAGGVNLHDG